MEDGRPMTMDLSRVQQAAEAVRQNVGRVIVGDTRAIDLLLVALLVEGHVLIEDVPGIGKTTLAKALSRSLGASFHRIQFTPDLLPGDITGVSIFNPKTDQFEYRSGPVFANVLLADEINRATPRAQSALLEAMEEQQVTVDGVTYPLPRPFIVLATQNPIELEGTFPLPEAQIDRFLMRLRLGYPAPEEERAILRRFRKSSPLATLEPVVSAADLAALGELCTDVLVHETIENYLIALANASRADANLALGISPRGTLALYRAAQALAAVRGRGYVTPDDVQELAEPILAHRLIPSAPARLRGHPAGELVASLLKAVPVPVEESWSLDGRA
jgi:MoxR-like ATPase